MAEYLRDPNNYDVYMDGHRVIVTTQRGQKGYLPIDLINKGREYERQAEQVARACYDAGL